jgi:hypothetical protein
LGTTVTFSKTDVATLSRALRHHQISFRSDTGAGARIGQTRGAIKPLRDWRSTLSVPLAELLRVAREKHAAAGDPGAS